jgi:hypothetical protein
LGLESRITVSIVNVVIAARAFRRIIGGFCGTTLGLIFVVIRDLGSNRFLIEFDWTVSETLVLIVRCIVAVVKVRGGGADSVVAQEVLDGIRFTNKLLSFEQ